MTETIFSKYQTPPDVGDESLQAMFDMQKQLLVPFIEIEGLPNYPVDVNKKENQIILKDFMARISEELSEGFYEKQHLAYLATQIDFTLMKKRPAVDKVISSIKNYGEEHADAMHFMLELMLYSNLGPSDVQKWLDRFGGNHAEKAVGTEDVLKYAMDAGYLAVTDDIGFGTPSSKIRLENHLFEERDWPYLKAGLSLSYDSEYDMIFLWHIVHTLNEARFYLKNRPWKQTQTLTNEESYQYKVVEAFCYLTGYFKYVGLDVDSLYYLYYNKNLENRERVKNKR